MERSSMLPLNQLGADELEALWREAKQFESKVRETGDAAEDAK
jgi:hypothetical protein